MTTDEIIKKLGFETVVSMIKDYVDDYTNTFNALPVDVAIYHDEENEHAIIEHEVIFRLEEYLPFLEEQYPGVYAPAKPSI